MLTRQERELLIEEFLDAMTPRLREIVREELRGVMVRPVDLTRSRDDIESINVGPWRGVATTPLMTPLPEPVDPYRIDGGSEPLH